MAIHHSTKTRAEKIGVILTELTPGEHPQFAALTAAPAGTVQAYWGKYNVYAFGAGEKPAANAVDEITAIQAIKDKLPGSTIINDVDDPFLIRVYLTHERLQVLDRDGTTPRDALLMIEQDKVWQSTTIPLDGGEAHKQGFPITDNPHDEETDAEDFAAWDEAWEASADEADAEDSAEDEQTGSVVRPEYRLRYAELGHPAHCGDELAVVLNNLVLGKKTDIEKFEAICAENGVDLSKYDRVANGWQGRLRMTGRNLMARVIYANNGILKLPEGAHPDGVTSIQMPESWMAKQNFKLPKKSATPEALQAQREEAEASKGGDAGDETKPEDDGNWQDKAQAAIAMPEADAE